MTKNIMKLSGGQVFHGALKRSLAIKRFVESRILKCRNNCDPVKFAVENGSSNQKGGNQQFSVNKCFRRSDLKHLDATPTMHNSLNSTTPEVPAKFFCLPYFDRQIVARAEISPKDVEDKLEFAFVDYTRF